MRPRSTRVVLDRSLSPRYSGCRRGAQGGQSTISPASPANGKPSAGLEPATPCCARTRRALRTDDTLRPRTATADRVVKSICPYCAVGCGQNVYVKDERVIQIEGEPDSPISRGRLCPKGSASFEQLVNSPQREYRVKYRRPYGHEWESLDFDTAMDMIADRMVGTRWETWEDALPDGSPLRRTLGLGFLGGATLDRGELPAQEVRHRGRRDSLRSKRQQRRVRQFTSNRFHRACVTRRRSRD